ncbi:MAG: hypothetical protein WAQ08_15715 [Aquabacterium sp.]
MAAAVPTAINAVVPAAKPAPPAPAAPAATALVVVVVEAPAAVLLLTPSTAKAPEATKQNDVAMISFFIKRPLNFGAVLRLRISMARQGQVHEATWPLTTLNGGIGCNNSPASQCKGMNPQNRIATLHSRD